MPVLMIHGNMESPHTYLKHEHNSPALILIREGFEVWLGSSRGSKYSKDHEWLNPEKDKEYWNFSWEEMGKYDLPAFIEKIVQISGYEKIGYVGLSQGTGQMYFGLSGGCNADENLRKYFQSRIKIFISLGTTLKFYHTSSPIMKILHYVLFKLNFKWVLDYLSIVKLGGSGDIPDMDLMKTLCVHQPRICELANLLFCDKAIFINDYDSQRLNLFRYPSSVSLKSVLHPMQLVGVDRWQCFDYGENQNKQVYNQTYPPEIRIDLIREIPIAIFHGNYDRLTEMEDVQWILDNIGDNLVHFERYDLGHSSFMTGLNMTYFEQDVVNVLNKFDKVQ